MADKVFNIGKGSAAQLCRDHPTAGQVILLKAAEADGALVDHADVASLIAAAGNTEADFTNYARKTGLAFTVTVDDVNDETLIDIANQVWDTAGGTTDNTLVKAIIAVQTGGGDNDLIPLVSLDFAVTTDGSDLSLVINSNGFFRARGVS